MKLILIASSPFKAQVLDRLQCGTSSQGLCGPIARQAKLKHAPHKPGEGCDEREVARE
jgi:hypothetical protein